MAKKLNGYDPHPVDQKDKLLEPKRTVKGKTKDKTSPNIKGCSGNDGKEHVYAHIHEICTYESGRPDYEFHYWGACIGCGKKPAYRKRQEPTGEPDQVIRRRFIKSMWERPIKSN